MSICRQFPIPSDRMGILWTVLPIQNCVVVEYGPAGTTHYGAEVIMDFGIALEQNLFCTHVDEEDMIMGDTSRLEKAIKDLDRERKPKCIFVIGSSLTSVIAADIQGICHMLEDEVEATLIPFEHGGFRGDFTLGIRDALTETVKALCKKTGDYQPLTYNIVGATHDQYRIGSDIEEIKDIMRKAFNMEVGCVLPHECSAESIANAPKAGLSLAIRPEAEPACQWIAKLGQGKIFCGAPYGYQGTLEFIQQVSEVIGIKPDEAYIESINQWIGKLSLHKMRMQSMMMPSKAVIEGEYTLVNGVGRFLKEELAFQEISGMCNHSLPRAKECMDWIIHYPLEQEKQKLMELKNRSATLVMGSDYTLLTAEQTTNIKLAISFPVKKSFSVANHLPYMGIRGANTLLETVMEYLNELTMQFVMH